MGKGWIYLTARKRQKRLDIAARAIGEDSDIHGIKK
jgi:hypothetical protein